MGFSQAPGLPYSKLGIPEDGDAASQAISKGKYVIWKGKNYFAKTDILQGETFVEDTNLTEIPDGALNGIADALNASFIHSTTEKEVGHWIDGSAIYQKSYYYNGTGKTSDFVVDSLIPTSYCKIIRVEGTLREGSIWYMTPFAAGGTTLSFTQDSSGLVCRVTGSWSITEYMITVLYVRNS